MEENKLPNIIKAFLIWILKWIVLFSKNQLWHCNGFFLRYKNSSTEYKINSKHFCLSWVEGEKSSFLYSACSINKFYTTLRIININSTIVLPSLLTLSPTHLYYICNNMSVTLGVYPALADIYRHFTWGGLSFID